MDKVYVSIFAKKAEKDASEISFEDNQVGRSWWESSRRVAHSHRLSLFQVTVDLRLPDSKRFVKTIELFGPIDPSLCVFQFFGTKVRPSLSPFPPD